MTSNPNNSETTPLMCPREKCGTQPHINLPLIVIVFVFILLPLVFLMFWGPYLHSSIATEWQKWELELRERCLNEQLREKEWEHQMQARELMEREKPVEWNSRQEREHQREEQWQRKEEAQQQLGLHWAKPEANAWFTAYNTHDYRACLMNTVPYHYNWLRPCMDIPIVIHNRNITTTQCEISQNVCMFTPFTEGWELTFICRN